MCGNTLLSYYHSYKRGYIYQHLLYVGIVLATYFPATLAQVWLNKRESMAFFL